MALNTKEYKVNGKEYYFSAGDFYEKRGKVWFCVDHVYNEKYRRIAGYVCGKEAQPNSEA